VTVTVAIRRGLSPATEPPMKANNRLGLAQPATYQIEVEGRLNENWSAPIGGLTVTVSRGNDGPTVTTLSGIMADQAALHSVLAYIRDLGLPLLSVHCIDHTGESGLMQR